MGKRLRTTWPCPPRTALSVLNEAVMVDAVLSGGQAALNHQRCRPQNDKIETWLLGRYSVGLHSLSPSLDYEGRVWQNMHRKHYAAAMLPVIYPALVREFMSVSTNSRPDRLGYRLLKLASQSS